MSRKGKILPSSALADFAPPISAVPLLTLLLPCRSKKIQTPTAAEEDIKQDEAVARKVLAAKANVYMQ